MMDDLLATTRNGEGARFTGNTAIPTLLLESVLACTTTKVCNVFFAPAVQGFSARITVLMVAGPVARVSMDVPMHGVST